MDAFIAGSRPRTRPGRRGGCSTCVASSSRRAHRRRAIASALLACLASRTNDSRNPMATAVMRTADRHAPAGPNRTTDRARPRRASSRATHPPSELPTMCARSIPARSSCSATPSASAPTDGHARAEPLRSAVARQSRREHRVPALQQRQHRAPHPPGAADAVQEHQRRAGAAGVRGRHRNGLRTAWAPGAAEPEPPRQGDRSRPGRSSRAALVGGRISGVQDVGPSPALPVEFVSGRDPERPRSASATVAACERTLSTSSAISMSSPASAATSWSPGRP